MGLADHRFSGHSFILGGQQTMGATDLNLVFGMKNLYKNNNPNPKNHPKASRTNLTRTPRYEGRTVFHDRS
jgi:hypothetical protein